MGRGEASGRSPPSILSLIRGMFADPGQRVTAVGAWTIAFTGGAVVGALLGGALLEFFWWGSVFLVNPLFMVVLVVAAPLVVPESRDPRPGGFDLPGAAIFLVAVLALVYAARAWPNMGSRVGTWASRWSARSSSRCSWSAEDGSRVRGSTS
ncbi:MFS transporter [Nocardiopsis sp. ATB16-24]|uniref:MFS transporter n=1 Tax=Nocardiopsis sp. ATB16-24 TaxID=3019555 RepID=UPI0025558F9D|nr:MFS transporter [Nocardiopsis sp. ATB16-24]